MTYQELLLSLEEPVSRISGGLNAIGVMTMGLSLAGDPYAAGFNAVWNYLIDAERDIQTRLAACLDTQ